MQRVPIRIYRLLEDKDSNTQSILRLNEWNYLQNKTEDDIDKTNADFSQNKEGEILVDTGDIFGATLEEPTLLTVFKSTSSNEIKDSNGNTTGIFYVFFNNEKYFIRNKEVLEDDNVIPNIFEFYVNPERITPTYKKLITETRTRGGWDVQHWGEQLTEIRVEGRTGGLNKIPRGEERLYTRNVDVTQSLAWKKLAQLKKLYDSDHNTTISNKKVIKLGFNYYDRFYIGYFTEFTGPSADAEAPFIMTYSFSFKVEEEILFDSSLRALNGV
ncbi:MAG: hypothetical protein M0R03_14430 [Novosphingobium sp.]|nr:hypothetical protein [Novosphingobium sp.]